jgi:hypothetical protein
LIQLIKNELDWDVAAALLYDPICTNSNCTGLLRGALNRGLQVSIVEFAYQTCSAMSDISRPDYQAKRQDIFLRLSELMLVYEGYLRPRLMEIQLKSREVLI